VAGAVDGHEAIDAPRELDIEKMPDAAKIAQPLLTDGAHEGDRSGRRDRAGVQRSYDPQHDRQAATVVRNPGTTQHRAVALHGHVGLEGEDGIEMGGEDQVRRRCRPGALTEHVPLRIDAHVDQTQLAEVIGVGRRPLALAEGRSGNLAQTHLVLDDLRFMARRILHCGANRRPFEQASAEIGGPLLGDRRRRRKEADSEHGQGTTAAGQVESPTLLGAIRAKELPRRAPRIHPSAAPSLRRRRPRAEGTDASGHG